MPWVPIGTNWITKNWTFTDYIGDAELFRLTHHISDTTKYVKAMVALAFTDGEVNFLNPRRISYRTDAEILEFEPPKGIYEFRLAIRRMDSSSVQWKIKAEAYKGYTRSTALIEKIDRVLLPELRESIMSYLVNHSAPRDMAPVEISTILTANTPARALAAFAGRIKAVFRCNVNTKLYSAMDETTGELSNLIEEVQAGQIFLLPNESGSVYKGDVYAVAEKDGAVSITEWRG